MPPWDLRSGTLRKRALETKPNSKKHFGDRPVRELLVRGILIWPLFMWCLDGATTMAMAATSLDAAIQRTSTIG